MKQAASLWTVLIFMQSCAVQAGSQLLGTGMSMNWTYTNTSITFTVVGNSTGWIGIGFSPNGGMTGADIVTLTAQRGKVNIQDRHAIETGLPLLDAQQDYKLISGNVTNGQIKATFYRALDTCDTNDAIIGAYTTKVIYAFGNLDASGTPEYHGSNRGSVDVYLLSPVPTSPNDTGMFNIDLKPQNITVRSNSGQTVYWCSFIRLQNVTNKSHVIQTVPMITPGNEDIVHHMQVYSCTSVDTSRSSFDCTNTPMPCVTLIAGWSVGSVGFQYPQYAGLPVGENIFQYVMLQTHFNLINFYSDRIDASYIRLVATTNLRPNDAGILPVGIVPGIFIPPYVDQMLISGYCTPRCLSSNNVPVKGINVFAVGLHAHVLGKRVTLRQFRPSQSLQLPVIFDDPYYDFNFMGGRMLEAVQQVLPGDLLQTVCTMSSSNRSTPTMGGLATTTNEMCISYLTYYPNMNLKSCMTVPSFVYNRNDSMYQILGKNSSSFSWTSPYTNDGLQGARWSTSLTQVIQAEYFSGTVGDICTTNSQTQGLYQLPTLVSSPLSKPTDNSAYCNKNNTAPVNAAGLAVDRFNAATLIIKGLLLTVIFV